MPSSSEENLMEEFECRSFVREIVMKKSCI